MEILDFVQGGLILLIIACILWIGTQIAWLFIQGALKKKQQDQLMDAAYSKIIRLVCRAKCDIMKLQKGGGSDGSEM